MRSRKAEEYRTLMLGKVIWELTEAFMGVGWYSSLFILDGEAPKPFWVWPTKTGRKVRKINLRDGSPTMT